MSNDEPKKIIIDGITAEAGDKAHVDADEPGNAFQFDLTKMTQAGVMMLGQAAAYKHIADQIQASSNATLDLAERRVLKKVIATCMHHFGMYQAQAMVIAHKVGAVKKTTISKGTDSKQ